MAQKTANPVLMKVMVDISMATAKYHRVNFSIHQYKESITPDGESDTELLQRVVQDIGVAIPAIRNELISIDKALQIPGIPKGIADDLYTHKLWCTLTLDDLDLVNTQITQMMMTKSDYVQLLSNILAPYYDSTELEEDFSGFEEDEDYEDYADEDGMDDGEDAIDTFEAYNNPPDAESKGSDGDSPIIYSDGEDGLKPARVDPETLEPIDDDGTDGAPGEDESVHNEDVPDDAEDEEGDLEDSPTEDETDDADDEMTEESEEELVVKPVDEQNPQNPNEDYSEVQGLFKDVLEENGIQRGAPTIKETKASKAQAEAMLQLLNEMDELKAKMESLNEENTQLRRDNTLLTAQMTQKPRAEPKEATAEDVMRRLVRSGSVTTVPERIEIKTVLKDSEPEEPVQHEPADEQQPGIIEGVTEVAQEVISKAKGVARKTATKSKRTGKTGKKRGRPKGSTSAKKKAAVKTEETEEDVE